LANGQERKSDYVCNSGSKDSSAAAVFSWGAKCRSEKCAVCAQSRESLPLKSERLYEYQNTQAEREREGERGEGMKQRKRDGGRGWSEARMIGDESQLERKGW